MTAADLLHDLHSAIEDERFDLAEKFWIRLVNKLYQDGILAYEDFDIYLDEEE